MKRCCGPKNDLDPAMRRIDGQKIIQVSNVENNNIIEESLLIKTPSPSNQLLTHSALSSDLFSIKNQDQHL